MISKVIEKYFNGNISVHVSQQQWIWEKQSASKWSTTTGSDNFDDIGSTNDNDTMSLTSTIAWPQTPSPDRSSEGQVSSGAWTPEADRSSTGGTNTLPDDPKQDQVGNLGLGITQRQLSITHSRSRTLEVGAYCESFLYNISKTKKTNLSTMAKNWNYNSCSDEIDGDSASGSKKTTSTSYSSVYVASVLCACIFGLLMWCYPTFYTKLYNLPWMYRVNDDPSSIFGAGETTKELLRSRNRIISIVFDVITFALL